MSDLMQTNGNGLPLLKKEKVIRLLTYGATAVAGVVVVNKFMPALNSALDLLIEGTWSVAELGIALGCTAGVIFAGAALWPVYKKGIESLANKATWALFEWDPITPMELWIKEFKQDSTALDSAYMNVDGVISSNEEKSSGLRNRADDAQKRFNVAVSKFGQDSHQANMAAIDVGTPKETADAIERNTESLKLLRDVLREVSQASEFALHQAEQQIESVKIQWAAAQETEKATNAAFRILRGRSQRSQDAQKAMEIVRNRFASQFGRVRALRKMSDQLINSVDLQQGVFHQEALADFRAQSALLTGRTQPVDMIDVTPVKSPDKISFYR